MVRKPIIEGMFYEADKDALYEQIKGCFLSEFGPGKLPGKKDNKKTLGFIAPHAGYVYSGPCAAFAFKELAEQKKPDTMILLGLSHSGYGSSISLVDWETPLGIVKNDVDFGKLIMENTSLKNNEEAHNKEHSIEAQIPFLQFIFENEDIKIAPIIASPDIDYSDLAANLSKTINDQKKSVCIITSSDFTHYGINYGFFPFQDNVKDNLYDLDKGAIEPIKQLNSAKLLDYIDKTGATICGKYNIAVLLELCKRIGGKKGELLKYYTSGDIVKDYSSAVGYASIKIE